MQSLGADGNNDHRLTQHRTFIETTIWEGLMQNAIATPALLRADDARQGRFSAPSMRAYFTLISAAALSGAALHMMRSTTAADLPNHLRTHARW